MNTTKFNMVFLYIGNPGSMYLPTSEVTYGNVMKAVGMPRNPHNSRLQSIHLKRVQWKLLDIIDRRCQENVDKESLLVACIDRYIGERVGCSSKFQASNRSLLNVCTTQAQYSQWGRLIGEIIQLGEKRTRFMS